MLNSAGIVATRLRCDGIFSNDIVLQNYCCVCQWNHLKIGQYLPKLWTKVFFSDSPAYIICESEKRGSCS